MRTMGRNLNKFYCSLIPTVLQYFLRGKVKVNNFPFTLITSKACLGVKCAMNGKDESHNYDFISRCPARRESDVVPRTNEPISFNTSFTSEDTGYLSKSFCTDTSVCSESTCATLGSFSLMGNPRTQVVQSPLYLVCATGFPQLPRDPFAQDRDGDTLLHQAIIQGNVEGALRCVHLARNASDLDIPNRQCQTALHLSVSENNPGLTRALISRGANPEVYDKHGDTPLHIACRRGLHECVHALVTPLNPTETQGLTYSIPFHRIPQNQNVRNYAGVTCVHLAVAGSHLDILTQLVQTCGADINVKDGTTGNTILHFAAAENRHDLIQYFLMHHFAKLDLSAVRYDGLTPLAIAIMNHHRDIAHLLRISGATWDDLDETEMSFQPSPQEGSTQLDRVTTWLSDLTMQKESL